MAFIIKKKKTASPDIDSLMHFGYLILMSGIFGPLTDRAHFYRMILGNDQRQYDPAI